MYTLYIMCVYIHIYIYIYIVNRHMYICTYPCPLAPSGAWPTRTSCSQTCWACSAALRGGAPGRSRISAVDELGILVSNT